MIESSFSCSIREKSVHSAIWICLQRFAIFAYRLCARLYQRIWPLWTIVSPLRYGWSVNVALQNLSYFLISASYVPIWKTCHTWVKTYSLARTRTFRTFAYSASAYRLDHRLHHLFPKAFTHTWCNAWYWRQLIIRSIRIRVCFVWITADIDFGDSSSSDRQGLCSSGFASSEKSFPLGCEWAGPALLTRSSEEPDERKKDDLSVAVTLIWGVHRVTRRGFTTDWPSRTGDTGCKVRIDSRSRSFAITLNTWWMLTNLVAEMYAVCTIPRLESEV